MWIVEKILMVWMSSSRRLPQLWVLDEGRKVYPTPCSANHFLLHKSCISIIKMREITTDRRPSTRLSIGKYRSKKSLQVKPSLT